MERATEGDEFEVGGGREVNLRSPRALQSQRLCG
jgi:hypothetical protein